LIAPRSEETALVTGASSGIGLELARILAANGHPLVIVARDAARLSDVAERLRSEYHVPVSCHACDLAEPAGADHLWAEVVKANTRVDLLVNNAGVGVYGEFHDQPADAIGRMQIVNVVALTTLTRLALPGMIARQRGRIMNVASIVGYQPGGPRMAVYYATKSYVLSFSKGIAAELAGSGVSVTVLCPGPTTSAFEKRSGAQQSRIYGLLPQTTARAVAIAGYRGMMAGRRVVIPGVLPKIVAYAGELSPSPIAIAVNRFLLKRM